MRQETQRDRKPTVTRRRGCIQWAIKAISGHPPRGAVGRRAFLCPLRPRKVILETPEYRLIDALEADGGGFDIRRQVYIKCG
jgi:hypothetical protein